MGEEEKKKTRVVESLGWLTESSIMPKKHKAIEGVGASSILELKAQLYKSQEESKKSKELAGPDVEYHRAKNKIAPNDPFSRKNSGVDARSHKDKLALKAVNDGSASYAALEKKAELYDKLVKGELSDEEDKEKYCVDFFHKGFMQDEMREAEAHGGSAPEPQQKEDDEDDAFISFNTKSLGLERTVVTIDNNEHKRFVREVHEEANRAREKVSELKLNNRTWAFSSDRSSAARKCLSINRETSSYKISRDLLSKMKACPPKAHHLPLMEASKTSSSSPGRQEPNFLVLYEESHF
ncbi:hypothetical protein Nepgr_003333 [Nepenthes gracilis]|uniref:Uncharacterized protein n=1 Tax=Nepenthes gracilis TaxID=150966 RepID=A0AAD3RZA2_NEPGR|nr:hypothetical protein Nepgr_003333 [Nepenthes gracilis]